MLKALNQSGISSAILLIVFVLLLGGIIGGSFFIKNVSKKSTSELSQVNTSPAANVKLNPQALNNYKDYKNIFYSFAYPNDYVLDTEKVITEHKIGASGMDTFGLSLIILIKTFSNSVDMIRTSMEINSIAYSNQSTAQSRYDEDLSFEEEKAKQDSNRKVESIEVDGFKGIKVRMENYNNVTEDVTIYGPRLVYNINFKGLGLVDSPNMKKEIVDFEKLLTSFKIIE